MIPDVEKILRKGIRNIVSSFSPENGEKPQTPLRSSSHNGRELCFVLQGESTTMLDGKYYKLTPGCCLFIDNWVNHAFGYQKCDRDLFHLWIWLNVRNKSPRAVLMEILPGGIFSQSGKIFTLPESYGEIFQTRLNALEKVKEKDEKSVTAFLRDPINSILAEFAFQREHESLLYGEKENEIASIIQSIKTHILMSNARNISYQTLEHYSGYSRSYLAHSFRKYTGMTIGAYINKVRLDYTETALKKGMTQKEIAYELGFSTPANFWVWLQKHKR